MPPTPNKPPFRETEWEEEADREHYGEECCAKLGLPLSCRSTKETEDQTRGQKDDSVVVIVIFKGRELKRRQRSGIVLKKKNFLTVFPDRQQRCSFIHVVITGGNSRL